MVRVADPLRPELDRHARKHFLGEDPPADAESASNTSGCRPASSTLRAAIIPDKPAPTMTTSPSTVVGCGMGTRSHTPLGRSSRNQRPQTLIDQPTAHLPGTEVRDAEGGNCPRDWI